MCGCKSILKCVVESVLLFSENFHNMYYISMYFPKVKLAHQWKFFDVQFFVGLKKYPIYGNF